ncbi:hypothetical protein IB276_10945 [Ensifer sp. ENS04]|uniref:hypothetical protein n=1 Tax=Ensifer sp. ENS04 TaxID=2769281 RepID=UPI001782CD1B|nr:hypothetical protein [Ensifer sp. ENS04]MBD9539968.1 hypothetical protein [Ensifer sp. ENS04]
MTDRIACINPTCRRTAPRAKFPDSRYIICRGCWNKLPALIKDRWNAIKTRHRIFQRLIRKPKFSADARLEQWRRVDRRMTLAEHALDASILHFFEAGQDPVGLDNFMKEIGLDR